MRFFLLVFGSWFPLDTCSLGLLVFLNKKSRKGDVQARHSCQGTVPMCKSKLQKQNQNRKPELFQASGPHRACVTGPTSAVSFLSALAGCEGACAIGDQKAHSVEFLQQTYAPPSSCSQTALHGSHLPRSSERPDTGPHSPRVRGALCGCSLGVKGIAGSEPRSRTPAGLVLTPAWGWGGRGGGEHALYYKDSRDKMLRLHRAEQSAGRTCGCDLGMPRQSPDGLGH